MEGRMLTTLSFILNKLIQQTVPSCQSTFFLPKALNCRLNQTVSNPIQIFNSEFSSILLYSLVFGDHNLTMFSFLRYFGLLPTYGHDKTSAPALVTGILCCSFILHITQSLQMSSRITNPSREEQSSYYQHSTTNLLHYL